MSSSAVLEQLLVLFDLRGQLLPLPEQLDEHLDLALQQIAGRSA